MKKLLIVDGSPAVRESIALTLGEGLEVRQSPTLPLAEVGGGAERVDLLIWGVSAGADMPSLRKLATRLSSAVLFLVDSKLAAPPVATGGLTDYLPKPFHPYELREKALRLLRHGEPEVPARARAVTEREPGRLSALEYPYLGLSTALLAQRFASARLAVLICGEAGSHHERVARAMHELGAAGDPWVSVYAAELDEESCAERLRELGESLARAEGVTLYLDSLERLGPRAQAALLRFLQEESSRGRSLWTLSASHLDLLERVYRGEFLEALYYELGRLTLRIAPLRERLDDLPALARRLARDMGRRLGLGEADLAPEALARLANYLWFGNLAELEAVIARTLSVHRVRLIEAHHLIFGLEYRPVELTAAPGERGDSFREALAAAGVPAPEADRLRNGAVDITALITELAHELKNPMVTIKTFSQLLEERYEDATFRHRFCQMVSGDIDRMDDILELLLEFCHFERPSPKGVDLQQALVGVWCDVVPDAQKTRVRLQAPPPRPALKVRADPDQLKFILRNLLRGVLLEAKPETEVGVEAEEGELRISYAREAGAATSLAHHLESASSADQGEGLSLRVLLAKLLAERNGGAIRIERGEGGAVRVRVRFPAAPGVEGA